MDTAVGSSSKMKELQRLSLATLFHFLSIVKIGCEINSNLNNNLLNNLKNYNIFNNLNENNTNNNNINNYLNRNHYKNEKNYKNENYDNNNNVEYKNNNNNINNNNNNNNNNNDDNYNNNNNKIDYDENVSNSSFLHRMGYKRPKKRDVSRLTPISPNLKPSLLVEKLLQNYIKTDPPTLYLTKEEKEKKKELRLQENSTNEDLDTSTKVSLGVYIISFYSVNEQTMDFSVSMYLRQVWIDPRLAFYQYNMTYTKLRMGDGSWNKIWIPDTFLRNEKGASFHTVTVENRMLELSENGRIWYVTKITATLSCLMTLEKFPMDTQICPMAFESFGYQMDTIYFDSLHDKVEKQDDLQLPQFTMVNSSHKDCSQVYTTGAYPCLEINFILKRDLGYFLIQVYVPSVLIVILSWLSFWINVDASPARVSIGLLTVLTTTTMSSGARSTLPRVSYIKAIDVWMIVCLLFVFTSLIEYAVVNVLARKVAKPSRPANQHPGPILKRNPPNSCVAVQQAQRRKDASILKCCRPGSKRAGASPEQLDGKRRARAVDKLSRKIFPLSFLIFNCIYWVYYSQQPEK